MPQHELTVSALNLKALAQDHSRSRKNSCFIFIFLEASGTHTIGEHAQSLAPKTIHFVVPGISQSFSGVKKVKGYCVEFSPDCFSRFSPNKEVLYDLPFFSYAVEKPSYKIPAEAFDLIYSFFDLMYHDYRDEKPGHERIIVSAINIVLLKCAQWFAFQNKSKNPGHYVTGYYGSLQLVENYRRLIREHFRREHFVRSYAEKLNLTPNYLNMVVKNITGFNASDLIRQQIISEAKYLLIHTEFSHKEVAHELGFSDQSYFTRFFKRETGQRPLDWFRKNR